MALNTFLSQQNAQLLWEVLLDDESIPRSINTQQTFSKVLPEFFEREKHTHTNLLEMNKNFMSLMLNLLQPHTNTNTNTNTPVSTMKKIEIGPKITFEELQAERISLFEHDLTTKQQEFTNSMTLPIPPTPVFTDNTVENIPISQMEEMIQRTIAERNFEIEKIYSQNQPPPQQDSTGTGEHDNASHNHKHISWKDDHGQKLQDDGMSSPPQQLKTGNIFSKLKISSSPLDLSQIEEKINDYTPQSTIDLINMRFDKIESQVQELLRIISEKGTAIN